jgi:hypothetical protein
MIRRTCRSHRRNVALGEADTPLLGQKILLAVDSAYYDHADKETDVEVLRRTLGALRELHTQTGLAITLKWVAAKMGVSQRSLRPLVRS